MDSPTIYCSKEYGYNLRLFRNSKTKIYFNGKENIQFIIMDPVNFYKKEKKIINHKLQWVKIHCRLGVQKTLKKNSIFYNFS